MFTGSLRKDKGEEGALLILAYNTLLYIQKDIDVKFLSVRQLSAGWAVTVLLATLGKKGTCALPSGCMALSLLCPTYPQVQSLCLSFSTCLSMCFIFLGERNSYLLLKQWHLGYEKTQSKFLLSALILAENIKGNGKWKKKDRNKSQKKKKKLHRVGTKTFKQAYLLIQKKRVLRRTATHLPQKRSLNFKLKRLTPFDTYFKQT